MSSRVTRALLKLYPRRIQKRYGQELLDLEDEMRSHGDISRLGLIRDMLAGALVIWPTRQRTRLAALAVLGGLGLVVIGAVIIDRGPGSSRRRGDPQFALVAQAVPVLPSRSCEITSGSSCSATPCTEFIAQSTNVTTGTSSLITTTTTPTTRPATPATRSGAQRRAVPANQPAQPVLGSRCNTQRHSVPHNAVVVAQPVTASRRRR